MRSEEQRDQVKKMTMQALGRLEQLKLSETSAPPPKAYSSSSLKKKADSNLLSELDSLPPPPKGSPSGVHGSRSHLSLPRGKNMYVPQCTTTMYHESTIWFYLLAI